MKQEWDGNRSAKIEKPSSLLLFSVIIYFFVKAF